MKTKKVDKKKTLAYAVAFYFTDVSVKFMMGNAMYEYVHTIVVFITIEQPKLIRNIRV